MIKLKQLIHDTALLSKGGKLYEGAVPTLKDLITLLKSGEYYAVNDFNEYPLWRGSKIYSTTDCEINNIRNDRKPKDTDLLSNALAEAIRKTYYPHIPKRSETLFCYNDFASSGAYGRRFMIVPSKNCKIFVSNIRDSIDIMYSASLTKIFLLIYNNTLQYDPIKFPIFNKFHTINNVLQLNNFNFNIDKFNNELLLIKEKLKATPENMALIDSVFILLTNIIKYYSDIREVSSLNDIPIGNPIEIYIAGDKYITIPQFYFKYDDIPKINNLIKNGDHNG